MSYYSAPVRPVVTKATVTPGVSNQPRVTVNAAVPEDGTSGNYVNFAGYTQEIPSSAHGEASITRTTPATLTATDLENVMADISQGLLGGVGGSTEVVYHFTVDAPTFGVSGANGDATMRSFILPEWPAALYGASLENRSTDSGGPWNPDEDDPNVNRPATATGWEIVEPGYVTDAYLVLRYNTGQNTDVGDPVTGYLTVAPGIHREVWNASTAQGYPAQDTWTMPDVVGSPTYYRTSALDPAALPQTAYGFVGLYASGLQSWAWRSDPTVDRSGTFTGVIDPLVVFRWQPPVYRWILSEPAPPIGLPPLRTVQRGGDGRGASSAPRAVQHQTRQATNRAVSCF